AQGIPSVSSKYSFLHISLNRELANPSRKVELVRL
ncbi:unnamed protein product, partial [marine sediment metagenome]